MFVSNTSYYVEVENGAVLRVVVRSRKMIFGDHGKSWKIFREKCGNRGTDLGIKVNGLGLRTYGLSLGHVFSVIGLKANGRINIHFVISDSMAPCGLWELCFFVRIGPIRLLVGCRKRRLNQG